MNKEQEKPQEDCDCHCHHTASGLSDPRYLNQPNWAECPLQCDNGCKHCEKPQEDIFDEFDKYWFISKGRTKNSTNAHRYEVKAFIRSNFIAKRDLRKLLEEKKRVMVHIVGAKRVEMPYVVIDDIEEDIEKL